MPILPATRRRHRAAGGHPDLFASLTTMARCLGRIVTDNATLRADNERLRADNERLRDGNHRLTEENERLRGEALIDDLTALPNRRMLRAVFHDCVAGRPDIGPIDADTLPGAPYISAVAMLDVDRFKTINDTYGHAAGDAVLRYVADLLGSFDVQGFRLAGDEFVVFVPADGRDAVKVLGDIAEALRTPFPVNLTDEVTVTASIGVVYLDEAAPHTNTSFWLHHLLRLADLRMYAAKAAGRDRVVAAERGTGR